MFNTEAIEKAKQDKHHSLDILVNSKEKDFDNLYYYRLQEFRYSGGNENCKLDRKSVFNSKSISLSSLFEFVSFPELHDSTRMNLIPDVCVVDLANKVDTPFQSTVNVAKSTKDFKSREYIGFCLPVGTENEKIPFKDGKRTLKEIPKLLEAVKSEEIHCWHGEVDENTQCPTHNLWSCSGHSGMSMINVLSMCCCYIHSGWSKKYLSNIATSVLQPTVRKMIHGTKKNIVLSNSSAVDDINININMNGNINDDNNNAIDNIGTDINGDGNESNNDNDDTKSDASTDSNSDWPISGQTLFGAASILTIGVVIGVFLGRKTKLFDFIKWCQASTSTAPNLNTVWHNMVLLRYPFAFFKYQ